MKKWMLLVLYALLFAVLIGLVVYEVLVKENLSGDFYLKAGLIGISALFGIVRLFGNPARSAANRRTTYQKTYAEFIDGAFRDDKKLENRFYKALNLYTKCKYAASLDILKDLRPHSVCMADRYAVTVFQGLCCHNLNLYKDALNYYQAAMQIRPNSTLACNQGVCHQRLGDYGAASEAYYRASQLDPDNANPYNNMAQLCIRAGDYEEALEYASAAYERNQTLVPALNALAICHYMLGNQEEYTHWYRQAISCGSDGAKLKRYIQSLDSEM